MLRVHPLVEGTKGRLVPEFISRDGERFGKAPCRGLLNFGHGREPLSFRLGCRPR